jgi:hypothetical protein
MQVGRFSGGSSLPHSPPAQRYYYPHSQPNMLHEVARTGFAVDANRYV